MQHFINNREITPRNLFDIGVKVDFEAKTDEIQVTTDSLLLSREAKSYIDSHIANIGIFDGLKYKVVMNGNVQLDYYIDLTEEHLIEDNQIQCRIKLEKNHDNFFDRASGSSFSLINSVKPINTIEVEYQILPIDAEGQAMSSFLAMYSITVAIGQQVKATAESSAEFASVAGYGFSAFGKIIEAGLKLVANIVYLALLVNEAINLAERIAGLINPKISIAKGVLVKELIEKGCDYLGYKFDSSIFNGDYAKLALMTVPANNTNENFFNISSVLFSKKVLSSGYPTELDSVNTLGDLFSVMESMFNAKTRVVDNNVYFERWDKFVRNTSVQLDSSLTDQSERVNKYKYDTSRLFKRYYIHYSNDYSDIVTLDNYRHQASEYSLESSPNTQISTIKGLTEINIPFSLAYTKEKTTWLEDVFEVMKDIFAFFTSGQFDYKDSKGVVLLSQTYFSTTKIFIHDGNKRPKPNSNGALLDTSILWDKFHYINSPTSGYYRAIYESVKFQMSASEFKSIYRNNFVTIDGLQCEIVNMEYFDEKQYALITYKAPIKINTNYITLKKIY